MVRLRACRIVWAGCALVAMGSGTRLWGQTSPAGTASQAAGEPTVLLNYHDVPVDTVVPDLAKRLKLSYGRFAPIGAKITLVSSVPVNAHDAAVLLNDAVWDAGYRIEALAAKGVVRVLVIRSRPTALEDLRTWPEAAPMHFAAQLPGNLAGISADATLELGGQRQTLSDLLKQFGDGFGFIIDPPPRELDRGFSIQAPKPLTARQAADVVSVLLGPSGYQLEGDAVEDARGNARTFLRVTALPPAAGKAAIVPFAFQDAPLSIVLAELGKRSGFATADSTVGVHVTLLKTLQVDAGGKADVGPLVTALNEQLARQGVIIEPTALTGADGKVEPGLSAMTLDDDRHMLLAPLPEISEPSLPFADWIGVDPKITMTMRYENVPGDKILTDVGRTFGFTVITETAISQNITLELANPVTAREAFELLNEALLPLGYQAVLFPSESLQGTILRVMSAADGRRLLRGLPLEPAESTASSPAPEPASAPLPGGSGDDMAARMKARREAELAAQHAATQGQ